MIQVRQPGTLLQRRCRAQSFCVVRCHFGQPARGGLRPLRAFSEGVGMGKAPKAANMLYASRIVLKLFKESHEKVVDVGGKKYFDMGLGTHLNFLEA